MKASMDQARIVALPPGYQPAPRPVALPVESRPKRKSAPRRAANTPKPDPRQAMSYRRALLAFGNGDARKGQQLFFMLAKRLEEARAKHPVFAEGPYQALGVIGEEYQEFVHAVEHETPDRALDEALDLLATGVRFVGREYEHAEKRP